MTYVITMTTGRVYRIDEYDRSKYDGEWLKFRDNNGDTTDRFAIVNIEHVDVYGRSNAELVERVNSNV